MQCQDTMKGPRKVLSKWKCQVHYPGKRGVRLWDRGHRAAARCSKVQLIKALDNPTVVMMVWSDTTRRKSHYTPYLLSIQICRNIICIICVSLCVMLYCLPYIVLVHEQIHTLGESKTAFSVKSPLVIPQAKKPLQISIQFPH